MRAVRTTAVLCLYLTGNTMCSQYSIQVEVSGSARHGLGDGGLVHKWVVLSHTRKVKHTGQESGGELYEIIEF